MFSTIIEQSFDRNRISHDPNCAVQGNSARRASVKNSSINDNNNNNEKWI